MRTFWDFPGCPVLKTSPFNAVGVGSIPSPGAKFLHASWPKHQNKKQKQYCHKFNKNFKKWFHKEVRMKSYLFPFLKTVHSGKKRLSCENQAYDKGDLLTWLVRHSDRGFGLNIEENILVIVSTI